MAVNVTKTNTKIYQANGWARIIYDTGQVDAVGQPITVAAWLTMAALEKESGMLLTKARVKSIVEAALARVEAATEQELSAALA